MGFRSTPKKECPKCGTHMTIVEVGGCYLDRPTGFRIAEQAYVCPSCGLKRKISRKDAIRNAFG